MYAHAFQNDYAENGAFTSHNYKVSAHVRKWVKPKKNNDIQFARSLYWASGPDVLTTTINYQEPNLGLPTWKWNDASTQYESLATGNNWSHPWNWDGKVLQVYHREHKLNPGYAFDNVNQNPAAPADTFKQNMLT